jgi:lipopolysaccharide cholinephosphotransferase
MEMKKVPLEEQKRILVEMLSYFDSFCRKHGIEYSITWGTLLGAVRHKGFIPWDDDIDIMMDRKNYKKLLMLYSNGNEKYQLLSLRNNKEWCYTFSRLVDSSTVVIWENEIQRKLDKHGVWIDISAVDNAPEDAIYQQASKKYRKYEKIGRVSRVFYKRPGGFVRNIIPWIFHIMLFPFSTCFLNKAESIMQSYNDKKCDRMFYWHLWFQRGAYIIPFPASFILNGYTDIQFEGVKVRAIKEYDAYLRFLFNDYMTLPPVEKRVSNHNTEVYWLQS